MGVWKERVGYNVKYISRHVIYKDSYKHFRVQHFGGTKWFETIHNITISNDYHGRIRLWFNQRLKHFTSKPVHSRRAIRKVCSRINISYKLLKNQWRAFDNNVAIQRWTEEAKEVIISLLSFRTWCSFPSSVWTTNREYV